MNNIISAIGVMVTLADKVQDFDTSEVPQQCIDCVAKISARLVELAHNGQGAWTPADFESTRVDDMQAMLREMLVQIARGMTISGYDAKYTTAMICTFVVDGHVDEARRALEGMMA